MLKTYGTRERLGPRPAAWALRLKGSRTPGVLCGLYEENVRAACCVAGAVFGVTSVSGAQVADSLRDLHTSLQGSSERLTIADQADVVTHGHLIELSDQTIRLMVPSCQVLWTQRNRLSRRLSA